MSTNIQTKSEATHSLPRHWSILMLSALLLIAVTGFLLWLIPTLFDDFYEEQKALAWSTIKGAEQNITLSIKQSQNEVNRIIQEYPIEIKDIVAFEGTDESHSGYNFLNKLVARRFPEHQSFAITNNKGEPVIVKRDSPFGQGCKRSIKKHILHPDARNGLTVVHNSGNLGYHYDVMAMLNNTALFFVSFPLDDIVTLLANAQLPHQRLVLVQREDMHKVEISAKGVRDIEDFDMPLSDEALQSRFSDIDVERSAWKLLALPEPGYIADYRYDLWKWSITGYSIFLVLLVYFTWRLLTEARQRSEAQKQLIETNQNLEQKVLERTRSLEERSQALSESRASYQAIIKSAMDAMISISDDGIIGRFNPAAERIFGYSAEQVIGQNVKLLIPGKHHSQHNCYLQNYNETGEKKIIDQGREVVGQHKNGNLIQLFLTVSDTHKSGSNRFSAVLRDITESKRLQEQLQFDAQHDSLTRLLNRREFERRLEKTLGNLSETTQVIPRTLLFMDLDQFKIVNDTAGHAAGDELLRQISSLLKEKIRPEDTLARIGGDEFALLMENCTIEETSTIANTIIDAVRNFQFIWGSQNFRIGISIGVTEINDQSLTLDEILSQADAACYAAKETGRNHCHIFSYDNEDLMRRKGEMWWTTEIIHAIEENRLVLYQQTISPISAEIRKNSGLHYEILIRMKDRDNQIIPPGNFLPAAERYKLMPMIDRWVVTTLFDWLKAHPDHLQKLSKCSINLSGPSLGDTEFHTFLINTMEQSHIPPEKICWEITETAAISNFREAQHFIELMRGMGCRFSLDDFGAGLSSFSYLKNLKVDYLKIDGSFVRDMVNDPKDRLIVESIHNVGSGMRMKTIAEFVQDDASMKILEEIGVDFAQGFGIARPVPLDDFEAT